VATVEVRDGRPVAVRTGGEELRREAAVLAALAGPGVPEVLEVDDERLVTSVAPPLPVAEVPAVAAELVAILARAHAAGITHGPLHDEHLLGAPGALLLAGWTEAGPGDPSSDVAEVGRLLERHAGGDARLLALAARAAAPDPPTMAALHASLAATAPEARRPVPLAVLAGLAVALALVAVGLLVRGGHHPVPAPAAALAPATSAPTTTSTVAPSPAVRVSGNVVERGGERWTVGRPGDLVVVGDWDCDGLGTPAVLRPSTGEVWLFPRWSAGGAPEAGRSAATVAGATGIRVRRAAACDRLVVTSADGQSTTVG
jgi:hypothetical protein